MNSLLRFSLLGAAISSFAACSQASKPPPPPGGTATIGASGGVLSVGDFKIEIPPGALEADTTITVTRVDVPDANTQLRYIVYGPSYRLEPAGLTFLTPVTISISFSGAGLEMASALFTTGPHGRNFEWLHSSWNTVDGASVAIAQTRHFSTAFIGLPRSGQRGFRESSSSHLAPASKNKIQLVRAAGGGIMCVGGRADGSYRVFPSSGALGIEPESSGFMPAEIDFSAHLEEIEDAMCFEKADGSSVKIVALGKATTEEQRAIAAEVTRAGFATLQDYQRAALTPQIAEIYTILGWAAAYDERGHRILGVKAAVGATPGAQKTVLAPVDIEGTMPAPMGMPQTLKSSGMALNPNEIVLGGVKNGQANTLFVDHDAGKIRSVQGSGAPRDVVDAKPGDHTALKASEPTPGGNARGASYVAQGRNGDYRTLESAVNFIFGDDWSASGGLDSIGSLPNKRFDDDLYDTYFGYDATGKITLPDLGINMSFDQGTLAPRRDQEPEPDGAGSAVGIKRGVDTDGDGNFDDSMLLTPDGVLHNLIQERRGGPQPDAGVTPTEDAGVMDVDGGMPSSCGVAGQSPVGLYFRATPETVRIPGSVRLQYCINLPDLGPSLYCNISDGYSSNSIDPRGRETVVTPDRTTTYRLFCSSESLQNSHEKFATVVALDESLGSITDFSASSARINVGESTTLTATFNQLPNQIVRSCMIDQIATPYAGPVTVSPVRSTDYTITCKFRQENRTHKAIADQVAPLTIVTRTVHVDVDVPPMTIRSFSATPDVVNSGGPTDVVYSWDIAGFDPSNPAHHCFTSYGPVTQAQGSIMTNNPPAHVALHCGYVANGLPADFYVDAARADVVRIPDHNLSAETGVTLTVTPTSSTRARPVTVAWNVSYVPSRYSSPPTCTLNVATGPNVGSSGSVVERPLETTLYELQCTAPVTSGGDDFWTKYAYVRVAQPSQRPLGAIQTFTSTQTIVAPGAFAPFQFTVGGLADPDVTVHDCVMVAGSGSATALRPAGGASSIQIGYKLSTWMSCSFSLDNILHTTALFPAGPTFDISHAALPLGEIASFTAQARTDQTVTVSWNVVKHAPNVTAKCWLDPMGRYLREQDNMFQGSIAGIPVSSVSETYGILCVFEEATPYGTRTNYDRRFVQVP